MFSLQVAVILYFCLLKSFKQQVGDFQVGVTIWRCFFMFVENGSKLFMVQPPNCHPGHETQRMKPPDHSEHLNLRKVVL